MMTQKEYQGKTKAHRQVGIDSFHISTNRIEVNPDSLALGRLDQNCCRDFDFVKIRNDKPGPAICWQQRCWVTLQTALFVN
jgi:hypothetical protein